MQLSDAQLRSISQARGFINLWDGPIRAGKSIGSLIRWLHFVAGASTSGVLVVTGKTMDTIQRNVFEPLKSRDLFGPAARQVEYTRGAPTGTILGRQVEVISGNDAKAEERLRGMTCAGWYADEVSLLPEQFFDQLIGRCSVPGAMGFGTTNPGAPNHWLRQRFILEAWKRSSGVRHWHFTMEDNPGLTEEFKNTLKALYTGMWFKRMILGLWVMAEGAIFDAFDEDRDVVDALPDGMRWIASGTDHGVRNPFHSILLGLAEGKLWVTHEYRWDSKKTGRQMSDAEYSEAYAEWLATAEVAPGVLGIQPEWEVVDPAAAAYRTTRYRDGATPYPGVNDVDLGLGTMASLFGRRLLKIHRRCRHLLAEIPGYSWDEKAAARGEDAPIKVDDHALDATRYAVETTRVLWEGLVHAPDVRSDAAMAAR